MSDMNSCSVCPMHRPAIEEIPDLDACVSTLADELMSTRAAAEEVRNYLNRMIAKIDELLDVLDEADWEFTEEDDE